jgi:hypothetical protein
MVGDCIHPSTGKIIVLKSALSVPFARFLQHELRTKKAGNKATGLTRIPGLTGLRKTVNSADFVDLVKNGHESDSIVHFMR